MKKEIPPGRPAPLEIVQAVVALASVCAKHNFPLDIPHATERVTARQEVIISEQAQTIVKQQKIMTTQREIIRRLEERLGIDEL